MARLSILLVVTAAGALLVNANPMIKRSLDKSNIGHMLEKAKYLYLSTNLKPNAIRAIPVNEDGSISEQGSTTLTGGDGSNEMDSTTHMPHAPDALGSQGSVQLSDNVRKSVDFNGDLDVFLTLLLSSYSSLTRDPTHSLF